MALYPLLYDLVVSRVDAERAHGAAVRLLRFAAQTPGGRDALALMAAKPDPRLAVERCGLRFANPIGVAAGLDKNAEAVEALFALGFGHVEIGTVTPRPQDGNPRPRVWRVPEARAAINALGFPSEGARSVRLRLDAREPADAHEPRAPLGVNVGKNKDTPLEQAAEDYEAVVGELASCADYLVINVSSPNTPGLRALQHGEALVEIIERTRAAADAARAGAAAGAELPLFVKLAPDLEPDEIENIAGTAVEAGAAGIIATNTTIGRDGVPDDYRDHRGGLSGEPLRRRATEICRLLYRCVGDRATIIGVGGIGSAAHVVERVRAGASLTQLYTAFIYEGPGMAGRVVRDLKRIADRDGWKSIDELVGLDC